MFVIWLLSPGGHLPAHSVAPGEGGSFVIWLLSPGGYLIFVICLLVFVP